MELIRFMVTFQSVFFSKLIFVPLSLGREDKFHLTNDTVTEYSGATIQIARPVAFRGVLSMSSLFCPAVRRRCAGASTYHLTCCYLHSVSCVRWPVFVCPIRNPHRWRNWKRKQLVRRNDYERAPLTRCFCAFSSHPLWCTLSRRLFYLGNH